MSLHIASAAVAIINCQSPRDSYLILRRAAQENDPWSGHFSFPGGRKDQADKDLLATCIRETAEETGILLDHNQLQEQLALEPAGRLLSRPMMVQPYIFTLAEPPSLRLDPKEIQGALWLDAERFRSKHLHQKVELLPGQSFPAYPIDDYYLWGFTYRLLRAILKMDVEDMVTTVSGK